MGREKGADGLSCFKILFTESKLAYFRGDMAHFYMLSLFPNISAQYDPNLILLIDFER